MPPLPKLSASLRLCVSLLTLIASARAAEPKNILFIPIDDLKPALGCYGDTTAITPHIDALAKSGVTFLNAQCNWPVCGPSRASLMTSLRPETVGVMDLKTDMRAKNPDVLSLPQHFKNAGYFTAGTGKIYDPRCVDNKKDNDAPSWSIPFQHHDLKQVTEPDGKIVARAPDVPNAALTDGQIAIEGIKLLKRVSKKKKPFFLAVGFKKPHLAFVAPKKYWDLYERDQFTLAPNPGGIDGDEGYLVHDSAELRSYEGVPQTGPIPEDLQRELLHGYYACASYIDALVGELIAELERLELRDDTIICLWGDHGFHLGDHSMWGKHTALEGAARAPLLFSAPEMTADQQRTAPVEFVDIFPTLCDLAGIETPEEIHGRSLVPVWNDETDHPRRGAITLFQKKGAHGYSYRTERYRYIEWINKFGKTVETNLFDYETDPLEKTDLADDPEYKDQLTEFAAAMREEGVGCERLLTKPKK